MTEGGKLGLEDLQREVEKLQAQFKLDQERLAPQRFTASDFSRIPRFLDKPREPGDITLQDWLDDVRSAINLRGLSGPQEAAFLLEHLGGKARREITGRGGIKLSGSQIFSILEQVFGDGNSLARLQSQFYSYKQAADVDLLTCSHNLVTLADRIEACDKKDSGFSAYKTTILKDRLAEAVADSSLRRELRRLNTEAPSLSFFDLRDRAIQWLGSPDVRQRQPTVEEKQADSELLELLKNQSEQIQQQQQQIQQLTAKLEGLASGQVSSARRCHICGSTEHLKRRCPQNPWNQRQPRQPQPYQPLNGGHLPL